MIEQSIFKAYDIRGLAGTQITPHIAYLIGRAYVQVIQPEPRIVAVGRDVREHGKDLKEALMRGLADEGVEIIDIGVISTDMLYFGVAQYGYGGGITVSASHNPVEYNGFKMVRAGAEAISGDTGITQIRDRVMELESEGVVMKADEPLVHVHAKEILMEEYIDYMMTFVDVDLLQKAPKMKIGFNANHGVAGEVITKLIQSYRLPIEVVGLYMNPDGSFPQGRPDPMYDSNRSAFMHLLQEEKCDFGCAWDADADRCFFFDEKGEFIDGYYITALLADIMLDAYPGEKIIHDPRLTWAVVDLVTQKGGIPLVNKVGHSFIKNRMREENAVFAGENSGHYYFREFFYADNGIIPFLKIYETLVRKNVTLGALTHTLQNTYFISGEINTTVQDPDAVIERIKKTYTDGRQVMIDGLSIEYDDWRCNIRKSNTEPLLRLNVEARSQELQEEKTQELRTLIS